MASFNYLHTDQPSYIKQFLNILLSILYCSKIFTRVYTLALLHINYNVHHAPENITHGDVMDLDEVSCR
jgi:hypothetical protein